MSALKTWRKSTHKTQEQLAETLGENSKTYSAYERGASPMPPQILAKLRGLGYAGPSDQHALDTNALTREDLLRAMTDLRNYLGEKFEELRPKK